MWGRRTSKSNYRHNVKSFSKFRYYIPIHSGEGARTRSEKGLGLAHGTSWAQPKWVCSGDPRMVPLCGSRSQKGLYSFTRGYLILSALLSCGNKAYCEFFWSFWLRTQKSCEVLLFTLPNLSTIAHFSSVSYPNSSMKEISRASPTFWRFLSQASAVPGPSPILCAGPRAIGVSYPFQILSNIRPPISSYFYIKSVQELLPTTRP